MVLNVRSMHAEKRDLRQGLVMLDFADAAVGTFQTKDQGFLSSTTIGHTLQLCLYDVLIYRSESFPCCISFSSARLPSHRIGSSYCEAEGLGE